MYSKIIGEQQVQILSPSFSISPSNEDYVLNISANGRDFSPLFAVSAGVTRLVSNVAPGSYYKLVGNQSEVIINWQRICVTEGGGSGTELEPVTEFPVGVPEGTVVALASGDTVGVYQYDGSDWVSVAGGTGGGNVIELTRAEYEALTNPDPDTLYIITDADAVDLNDYAPASGLTELSGTVATINSNYATKQNVTARASDSRYWPGWNAQGVITGSTQFYTKQMTVNGSATTTFVTSGNQALPTFYAPTSKGTAGQVLQSPSSGNEPTWSAYKFAFMSQTDYDALTTKDATTIYFITGD